MDAGKESLFNPHRTEKQRRYVSLEGTCKDIIMGEVSGVGSGKDIIIREDSGEGIINRESDRINEILCGTLRYAKATYDNIIPFRFHLDFCVDEVIVRGPHFLDRLPESKSVMEEIDSANDLKMIRRLISLDDKIANSCLTEIKKKLIEGRRASSLWKKKIIMEQQQIIVDLKRLEELSSQDNPPSLIMQSVTEELKKKMEKQLKKIEVKRTQHFRNAEKINYFFSKVKLENSRGKLSLAMLADFFTESRESLCHEYYQGLDLADAAYSLALALFTDMFQYWNPLQNPAGEHLLYVATWKDVLQSEELYSKLISQIVLPAVKVSGNIYWDTVRDPVSMLKFLESWDKLLSSSAIATILDTVIIPKLSGAINSWVLPSQNSTTDTVSIKVWLHPWLPLLERHCKLELLHRMILAKLMNILEAWPSGDFSPEEELAPWKTVIGFEGWKKLRHRMLMLKLIM